MSFLNSNYIHKNNCFWKIGKLSFETYPFMPFKVKFTPLKTLGIKVRPNNSMMYWFSLTLAFYIFRVSFAWVMEYCIKCLCHLQRWRVTIALISIIIFLWDPHLEMRCGLKNCADILGCLKQISRASVMYISF